MLRGIGRLELDQEFTEKLMIAFRNVGKQATNVMAVRLRCGEDVSDVGEWIAHFLMGALEAKKAETLDRLEAEQNAMLPNTPIRRGEKLGYGQYRVQGVEMKPCPFCGGSPYLCEVRNEKARFPEHRICVQCEHCLARTQMLTWKLDKMPETAADLPQSVKMRAVMSWNERAVENLKAN